MNSELSRIHSLVDSDGTTHLADYTYLGRDRTVQVDFAEPGAKFTYIKQGSESPTDGGDQYTGWDRFGRAIDLRWIKNSSRAELERLQHGYDRASNRLYRKNLVAPDADKQDELYTYDGLSQLSVFQRGELNGTDNGIVSGTLAAREQFVFDPTGNWNSYVVNAGTPQTRTHNKANEVLTIDGTSSPVGEDAAGNMTKVPKPDSWSSAYDLKYDAWNRLVEVRDGSTVVATYAYDGLNRRTKKVMGSDTRHFYYTDKWQIIEERVNASTSADRQFVWGIRYTDDLVLRDKGTERLYVIQDYFQPTAVMDTSGAVLERYGYEAFGTSRVMEPDYTPLTDSAYEWETRFGAYRWDGETKMLQVRYRYLHTQLGRWVTRDPIGYKAGINLYGYVYNNPVREIDFLGLAIIPYPTSPLPPPPSTGNNQQALCCSQTCNTDGERIITSAAFLYTFGDVDPDSKDNQKATRKILEEIKKKITKKVIFDRANPYSYIKQPLKEVIEAAEQVADILQESTRGVALYTILIYLKCEKKSCTIWGGSAPMHWVVKETGRRKCMPSNGEGHYNGGDAFAARYVAEAASTRCETEHRAEFDIPE